MSTVTALTKEQINKFEEYVNKYVAIGTSTKEIDEVQLEKDINIFYKEILQYKEKPIIKLMDSPIACWNFICDVVKIKLDFVYPFIAGSFDSNIFSFYDFFINEIKDVKISEKLLKKYYIWHNLLNYGIIYPFEDYCIVSRLPIKIKFNKDKKLHCDDGKSIEYRDGFGIYSLNGVTMTEEYVMTPWDKLDPKLIQTETNVEIRRELVRKIGIERVCEKLNAECIDIKDDYELLLLDIGDNVKRPYLKMKNPSIGVFHIEGVHPDCKTVNDALRFRNGTDEKPFILT